MKLELLLEDDSQATMHRAKQFALGLQQALLEKFDDLDVEIKSISQIPSGWYVILEPAFESYARYRPKIDVSASTEPDCLVGISRRDTSDYDKDHLFLRRHKGRSPWENSSDPDLLAALEQRFLGDIARLVGKDVNERVKVGTWDLVGKTDFEPFDYSIPAYMIDREVGLAIAKATLAGLYVRCTAIPNRENDPIGSNQAINDFNDRVLRKAPKPQQIKVATNSSKDVTFFIYATHEAPTAA